MFFLAEFYLPASAALSEVVRRAATGAAAAASAGAPIRLVQAVFVPSDEICFALYEAGSAADVTAAGLLAGLEFERVTAALAVL